MQHYILNDLRHPVTLDQNARILELEGIVARLERELDAACHSDVFGCLNRAGLLRTLERLDLTGLACVYWDLDDLKVYNDLYGKPGVNDRVKAAITARDIDFVAGQVFSGDEFSAFPFEADAEPFADRLLKELHARGLSATFAVFRPLPNETAHEVLARGERMIKAFKQIGKGRVYTTGVARYQQGE